MDTTDPLAGAMAEPTLFGEGVISTEAEEWGITFTPDGRTAYFARSDAFFPQSRQATIMETHWGEDGWSEPVAASFSGQWSDIDPFVSPDGSRLFFSSIRPVEGVDRKDLNLWMVERVGNGWGEPVYLGDGVNSERDELYASITADRVLYFASDRTGGRGGWDIYRAVPDETGAYPTSENLGVPVNTIEWEFNPDISQDGSQLLFTSLNRPGGAGAGDIYVSGSTGSGWSEPEPLSPLVNTAADEYHPRHSSQGDVLFFVRRRGQGDLFYVRWDAVRP